MYANIRFPAVYGNDVHIGGIWRYIAVGSKGS
jgi:hypothetical protein